MSFGRPRGRPVDDPDSQGPASSATSGTEEGPRTSSDHIETEDNPQLQGQAQSSTSSSDQQKMTLRHNVADGGQARRRMSQGEPSLSQVAWPAVGEARAGAKRERDCIVPPTTSSSGSQQEYHVAPKRPNTMSVVRPAIKAGPSVPCRPHVDSSPSMSSHYDSHSAGVAQVPQLPTGGEAPTHQIVEQPLIDPRLHLTLPDSTAWEHAALPSPPSSGEHAERPWPNRRAQRPVNWDTDSSSYPTTSGSSARSTSSGTLPSHSSSPHDTTVSDSSSYPTSSSSTAQRTSSSLSSTSSQQQQGRLVTSSSGLGDVSESSDPALDRSGDDGELFHRPTQTPRLPEPTQVDLRTSAPRSVQTKISDESTTSSSSCGPPQRIVSAMTLRDPPQHREGRDRDASGRGAGTGRSGHSDAKKDGTQLEAEGDSVACYKLPGWIERPPATEEEAPQGGEGDRHGNRKRPSPNDSSPPTPPAKLARMDSLELPGSNTSLGQHSPEGGGSSVQTMLPHWIVEERERERQQRGVSARQLSDGPLTSSGSDATGNGSNATGGSSLAARPSAFSELPVPVQHSTPSHSCVDQGSPDSAGGRSGTVLVPETVEQACGRGIAAPPTVTSENLHVLVPDTPVASVGGVEGHGSGTLAVPDTQDSLQSCVHMREESKEEEELFSPDELMADKAPHCSFSLQLSSSQINGVLACSQEDVVQPAPAAAESVKETSSSSTSSSSADSSRHQSKEQASSGGSSSDGGAGVGGAGGGGAGAEGHGGGEWTTSADSDDTQELGGPDQRGSEQDSVVVLDGSSISAPMPSDVRPSGEVPVGANEDVIVLGDSLTVEVQGATLTVREMAPTSEDYEGETLPYSTAEEQGREGGEEVSLASPVEAGQQATSSNCSSDPKSTPTNPFKFTTTRSPSKRAGLEGQGGGTSEPREGEEDPGHHTQHEHVTMEMEHQPVARTDGGPGKFVLAREGSEQQNTSDSEFVLPAVQVQTESQSQFQDEFLFQPSFRINRPTVPTTTSSNACTPQTPPTFTERLATLPAQMPPHTDPYLFTSQDGPFPERPTPQLPGLAPPSPHTSHTSLNSSAPVVNAFDKSLCGKFVTRKTVVTRQVTTTIKEVTTECIKDGVVFSRTTEEVCDEPPRVSTHSTFGLFVDDTSFLTEVPLVGTPPLSEGVSTPGGVSTPTASIPTDQLRLHSTPNANSQTVSGEPRSATPSRSGGRVSQKSNRKAPKGKGRRRKVPPLEEDPLAGTSCVNTSSAVSDGGQSCGIVVGSRVLAKWEDGLWFPGHVSVVNGDKSVDITFDDGESGRALLKDVILIDQPLPNGLEVLVKPSRSLRHIKGVVKGCPGNSPNGPYIVAYSKASGKFYLREMVMVNKQALRLASLSRSCQGAGPSSRRGTTTLTPKETVPNSSDFFSGKFFVLTTSSGDQEGEKSYDRDALTSDIVRHGGMVVGSPLEVGGDMDGVFCVSDGPCRKRKFLLALAVGLPCVSFQFVLECVKQKCMVNFEGFLLPVGVSSTTGEHVAWTPVRAGTILEGVNILVAGDESFKNQWEEILQAAGAHILGRLSLTSGGSSLLGGSETEAPPTVVIHQPTGQRQHSRDVSAILRRAEGLGVPTVQVEWAVESLMHRRRMALDQR